MLIYINTDNDNPIIPVIIPAFPILLPVFLADLTPNTILKIPVGNAIYQNKANTIDIKFSNSVRSTFKYDSEKGYYLRSVNGKAHTDYVTKEQYHFKNIITYQVKNQTISGDKKVRQDINNIGSGKGYYITNGYAVPIKWKKDSRSSQTIYTYEDGTKIEVNDGNTFIEIQPTNQKLTIE